MAQTQTAPLVIRSVTQDSFAEWAMHITHTDIAAKVLAAEFGPSLVLPYVMSTRRYHEGGVWSAASGESKANRSLKTLDYLLSVSDECRGDLGILYAQASRFKITKAIRGGKLLLAATELIRTLQKVRQWKAARWVVLPKHFLR